MADEFHQKSPSQIVREGREPPRELTTGHTGVLPPINANLLDTSG